MRSINVVAVVAVILAISLGEQRLLPASAAPSGGVLHHGSAVAALHAVAFEPNVGQADKKVRYIARTPSGTLLLQAGEVDLATSGPAGKSRAGTAGRLAAQWAALHHGALRPTTTTLTRLEPLGTNRGVIPVAVDRLPGIVNYYVGKDQGQWQTDVPTYARIEYRNLYRGIDLAWYGTGSRLEYDWVLHPGANPSVIRLRVTGSGTPRLDGRGNLLVGRGAGEIVLGRPGIYQVAEGSRQTVAGSYVLHGTTISIRLGRYDRSRTLVIDPGITTRTIDIGGSNTDSPGGIAVDAQGNSYLTGTTTSTDFPMPGSAYKAPGLSGGYNAYVSKLSPDLSTILWTAIIGGKSPILSGIGVVTDGFGIDIAKNGDIIVVGDEADTDFPTLSPFMNPLQTFNGWLGRLGASDGHLIQLTEIGPTSGTPNLSSADVVAADRSTGDVYVGLNTAANLSSGSGVVQSVRPNTTCTITGSNGQPTSVACLVTYIMRVSGDPTYSFQTGTYLAPTGNGTSIPVSMEVGTSGGGSGLYVTGGTSGAGMPVSPGAFQGAPSGQGNQPWVAVLPPSLGSPYLLSYVNPTQGGATAVGITVGAGFMVFGVNPFQMVGSNAKFDAQVGVWKLDTGTGLPTGAPSFTRVAQLVSAIPQNHWNVFFDYLVIPRNWTSGIAATYGINGTPLALLVNTNFTAGAADSVPFITVPTMDGSGALHADVNPPVVVRSTQEVDGIWIDSIADPANGWFTRAALVAAAAVSGLVSTIAPPGALEAAHRPAAQGTGNHGGIDTFVVGLDQPVPAKPTATPVPAKKTTKCPKNSSKKNGKCACKKGYVKKNGKCVKKKKK